MKIKRGSTSVRRLIFIADSSSTTGAGLTSLVFNTSGLVAYYFAGDLSNEVQITLATATLGTFTSGGFIAVDNTNMPGWYEIGIPDAALDGGNEVCIQLRGAANMVPVNIHIQLDAFDYQTATQPVNVTQFGGSNLTSAAGIPEVKVQSIANNAITAASVADGAIDTATFAAGATLPRVTLVDTCSVNSDMRGTDGAYTGTPPTASAISTQVAADLLAAHGSGSWTTATGFATPINVTDAVTSIKGADSDTLKSLSDQIDGIDGGGGGVVNVLPATGIVADRSAGITLNPVVGETISQSITVYQSDGTTAVDLSGKTLKIIFETMSGTDVAVVPAADITISGTDDNIVTFAYPSAVTASERSLRFAIRDAAAPLTMYLQGVCSVVAAPKVDA